MKTVSRIHALQKILAPLRGKKKVGLVPTMGALHEGHLSLIRRAKRECGCVVVSLFVNPLQFGPKEDFKIYPRDLPGDRKKAASAGADLLWAPSVEEMFPPGHQTFVEVEGVGRRWEGASRPGHFRGVATVVAKLFQIVRPDRVYLGQKDYQQARVILRMVRDLAFDLSVRICPTLREKDGLAMSSRNQRLSAEERKAAPVLYKALRNGEALIREGERESRRVIQRMEEVIRSEARAKIDYIALADPETLEPIDRIAGRVVLLGGVKIGAVRLIDNLVMNIHE